jgi:hypothetical protein
MGLIAILLASETLASFDKPAASNPPWKEPRHRCLTARVLPSRKLVHTQWMLPVQGRLDEESQGGSNSSSSAVLKTRNLPTTYLAIGAAFLSRLL